MALLANLTPADLAPHARHGSALWSDGLGARIAFLTPPADTDARSARFPSGERAIPEALTRPLREWHERLGLPQLSIEGSGARRTARVVPAAGDDCAIGAGVFDAYYAYHDALRELTAQSDNTDLDASYARFHTKALRVAMLLASLENRGRIERRHWAYGQQVAEGWRASLHALVAQLNAPKPSEAKQREDDARRIIRRHGASTAAQIARFMHGISSAEAARILDGLVSAGELEAQATQKKTKRYALVEGV